MESRTRSVVKALTWRVIATVITFLVSLFIIDRADEAAGISLAAWIATGDTLIKIGAYYGHERLWDRVPIGRPKEPEYYL